MIPSLRSPWRLVALALVSVSAAACSNAGGGAPVDPPAGCVGESYASTFEAVQKLVFARHGCAAEACHGGARSGGLDLRPEVAHANLIDVPSAGDAEARVVPGDPQRSTLWRKLAAATVPGSVRIANSPMPIGAAPLSEEELELVRLWIYGGAPATGTVLGSDELVDGCLPEVDPITIKPLDTPARDEGIQLVMPQYTLPAGVEVENCFASYYDFSAQIPARFLEANDYMFRFKGIELRQDPQSHHVIVNLKLLDPAELDHPDFGEWTCKGGPRHGEACEPLDTTGCGAEGLCGSAPRDTFACAGFGPGPGILGQDLFRIGGAQQAQNKLDFHPGVFAQMPVRGLVYWNSHAFNVTPRDHVMNARLNYYFAEKTESLHSLRTIFDSSRIFAANAAPYTSQTICQDHVLPQGANLYELSSHTHKHGEHFWVDLQGGERVYENFIYNDPAEVRFDPPRVFDSPDPAQRTLHFCATYNNGVAADGSPDPEVVTRSSRVPESARQPGSFGTCEPTACVSGKIGAPCDDGVRGNLTGNDDACDSSPGKGDGWCDACSITAGESTENEMFILIGSYFIP